MGSSRHSRVQTGSLQNVSPLLEPGALSELGEDSLNGGLAPWE